ncbi:MAG: ABC transporter permease [Thermomicrobiales bacterium]|nr:ABC transporter permease [Thermomicrobiales bacterium]
MTDLTVPQSTTARRGPLWLVLRKLLEVRELTTLLFLILVSVFIALRSPYFLTPDNLKAIVLGMSTTGIMAVGMTVLLVAGGFDLSVGSVLALGGALAGWLIVAGLPIPLAVLIGILVGPAIGLANGLLVTKVGINPLITTLGMMSIVRGAVLLIGGGFGISNLPQEFNNLGQTVILGFQSPIWVMVVLAIVGDVLLRRSRPLRQAYYVGGNERSARLSGIPVDRVKIWAFILTSTVAALAGVLTAARFGSASVTAGTGVELSVIAAVVIGGASLAGGEGTVLGAILGVLLLQVIQSALTLLDVPLYWQPISIGGVLILAVGLDAISRRVRHLDGRA